MSNPTKKRKRSFFQKRNAYFLKNKRSLLKQLEFARQQVSFYKKSGRKEISSIRDYRDFCNAIPLIDPENFARNPKMFSSSFPPLFIRHSSSTTGNPKKIHLTRHDVSHWARSGRLTITPYYKKGMAVSHSERKEKHYLSALDESIKESGGKVMKFDPLNDQELINCIRKSDILLDYAELIYYISERVSNFSVNLNKNLILSYVGDKLEKEDIKKIKENFKKIGVDAQMFSEYSTSEIGPIGCSVSKDNNLFKIIYKDNVFVEIIDPETGLPAQRGELVATALNRTGSVFIRYRTGDIGKLLFKKNDVFFKLERRKNGLKIASLFFSPDYAFRIIRRKLCCPVFCAISTKKYSFLGRIKIKIVTERKVESDERSALKDFLINKLDFINDVGSTVSLSLSFEERPFHDSEIRKGFRYRNK